MKELLRAMRPVKRRIRRNRLVSGAGLGFAAGAVCALAVLATARFVPIEGKWLLAGGLFAGGILLTAVICMLRPVKDRDAARAADRCGLQERAETALEAGMLPEEKKADPLTREMLEKQREDACRHLEALDVKQIRCKAPRKELMAGLAALLLCAATFLLPGEGDRKAAERQELRKITSAMAEQAEAAAAADEEHLDEEEKQELRKITGDLKRDLSRSRDTADALLSLDRAEKRLEQMRNRTAGEAQDAMAEALQNAGLDQAAEAVRSGDSSGLQEALAEADAAKLQQALENMGAEAGSQAQQMLSGEMTAEQMQSALQAMQGQAGEAQAMQQALNQMKAALTGSGTQSASQGTQSASGGGQNGQNGAQGGGAGRGTTNLDEGGNGQKQQSGSQRGNAPPELRQGQYETIYDPEKAETLSRDVMTEQQRLGEDSVQIEAGPGRGRTDGDVPFSSVAGEYVRTETQAADQASLTGEQRQWVDDYFRFLTEESN